MDRPMSGALVYPDELVRRAFAETSTIAVVGASSNPARASHYVMAFLQARGWRTIPINPNEVGQTINGERVYGELGEIPVPVQLIDVFRNSAAAGAVVDEAIALKKRLGIRFVWMQLGVRDDTAAKRGEIAGLAVIMNRCPKIEIPRLFGSADREGILQAKRASSGGG
jgi:predicted CoA-binding protein